MTGRLAGLLSICGTLLSAQELHVLQGTVRDASQAVVPNATVSCSQEEQGFHFAVVTDRKGRYSLTVPVGHYNIIALHRGFRAAAKVGVSVNDAAQIDSLLDRFQPDIVQLPLNVLDQRLLHSGHLARLKAGNARRSR